MDKTLWGAVRDAVRSADRSIPRVGRRPRFTDRLVVKMYFWSVAHDRPRRFAARRDSYHGPMRPRELPSYSQFCRRLKSPRVVAMIAHTNERLRAQAVEDKDTGGLAFIDGKALAVSESSADPDARTGRGNGRFSRGYKLHAIGDESGRVLDFEVRPLNEAEPRVSRETLAPRLASGLLLIGDGNYDSKRLYAAVGASGSRFLAPVRKAPRGRRASSRTTPERLEAVRAWEEEPEATRALYRRRTQIERIFSALSCVGGGLGPLPAWVRRLDRVRLWVTAKIALYHARLVVKKRSREGD